MSQMLTDILSMITLDSGAVVTRPRRAPLCDLVAEALVELQPSGESRLDVRSRANVVLDPFHLHQILANLLANAARYGAPPVTIAVDAVEVDGRPREVCVAVADAGPGVPDEFIPRLFDRFTRANAASTASGSGFGLYIVRELVRVNHGTITYRPRSPSGAEFRIQFPEAT